MHLSPCVRLPHFMSLSFRRVAVLLYGSHAPFQLEHSAIIMLILQVFVSGGSLGTLAVFLVFLLHFWTPFLKKYVELFECVCWIVTYREGRPVSVNL